MNNIYLRCYSVHCLNRLSCLVFIMAHQMQYYMNSFSYTLKTKRLFLLVITTVSFTKHNGNHSENTATFCSISVFFLYSMRCDINWPETTMFWSKNSQLSADIVVGTFNFANSSFFYRVRHQSFFLNDCRTCSSFLALRKGCWFLHPFTVISFLSLQFFSFPSCSLFRARTYVFICLHFAGVLSLS